jgi:hypothetical protein
MTPAWRSIWFVVVVRLENWAVLVLIMIPRGPGPLFGDLSSIKRAFNLNKRGEEKLLATQASSRDRANQSANSSTAAAGRAAMLLPTSPADVVFQVLSFMRQRWLLSRPA